MSLDKIDQEMVRLMEMKRRMKTGEATLEDLQFCENLDAIPLHFKVAEKDSYLFNGAYQHIPFEGCSNSSIAHPLLHIGKDGKQRSGLLWKNDRKYTSVIENPVEEISFRNTFLECVRKENTSLYFLTNLEGETFSFDKKLDPLFSTRNVRTSDYEKMCTIYYRGRPIYAHLFRDAEFICKENLRIFFEKEPISTVLENVIENFDDSFMKVKILQKNK